MSNDENWWWLFYGTNKPQTEQVQEQKKTLPYSIEKIGGQFEYEMWKEKRTEFEKKWQEDYLKREIARRLKAYKKVANQTPMSLSQAEKDELAYRKTRNDDPLFEYLPKHRAGEWDKQNNIEKEWADGFVPLADETKSSFSERIKNTLVKWFSAAFEK